MSGLIRSMSVAATAVLGLSLVAVPQPALAAPPGPVTVASGLDNPRQLSVRPGQRLYVAEAGSGEACSPIPGVDPELGAAFCGLTGAITEVNGASQRRVVTGLPAMSANGEVVGPSDVDVRGANITVLIGGMGGAASLRDGLGADYAAFGTLRTGVLRSTPIGLGNLALAADLNAWEVATNPDGKVPPDSNAVGFDALDSRTGRSRTPAATPCSRWASAARARCRCSRTVRPCRTRSPRPASWSTLRQCRPTSWSDPTARSTCPS